LKIFEDNFYIIISFTYYKMSGRSNTTTIALTAAAAIGAGTLASYFIYKYYFGKKYKGMCLIFTRLHESSNNNM
jgi:hypothetical protein